jgi:hypothetical protein
VRRALLALILLAACKDRPAPEATMAAAPDRPPEIPAAERQRGDDACKAYVEAICGCAKATPELARDCELAKALPEALKMAYAVEASPSASRMDVVAAHDSARKTFKECIEQVAKLPGRGCR